MQMESIEKRDLVHVVEGTRRICTVIEVRAKEPRYKVQFGAETGTVESFKSYELALVQKYTPRDSSQGLVLAASL